MMMTDKDAEDFHKQIENLKKGKEVKRYIPIDERGTSCLRCKDKRTIYVYKDNTESSGIVKVDCPMCSVQRPPEELRAEGLI